MLFRSQAIKFIEPEDGLNAARLNITETLIWIKKLINKIEPDVVIVFNFFYGAIVCLSLIGSGIPVYVSDRQSPVFRWPKQVSLFNKMVYSLCTPAGLIAQTELAAEKQHAFFKQRTRIRVIPNGLKEAILYPEIKRHKQILAVGRLNDYQKGFDRLIEAFAKIRDKDWQLVFAGGDEEGEQLKKQALELNVFERVIFLGKVKDIDRIYAEAGIFVIPSRSEGFPNALCEAMAAGLPCISFDFSAGPRDLIISGENGMIIPNGDISSLASAIDYLISEPTERERLGRKAMEISHKLDADKIANQWLDFLHILPAQT